MKLLPQVETSIILYAYSKEKKNEVPFLDYDFYRKLAYHNESVRHAITRLKKKRLIRLYKQKAQASFPQWETYIKLTFKGRFLAHVLQADQCK